VTGTALTGTVSAERSSEQRFDRRMNAVEDLGMDPTGEDPIDDVLVEEVPSNTLVQFPAGEYLLTDGIDAVAGTRFGVEPLGSTSDVEFVFSARGETGDSANVVVLSAESLSPSPLEEPTGRELEDEQTSTLLVYRENSVDVHDVRLADLDAEATTVGGEEPKMLTIDGPDDGVANYRLTVSGDVDAHSDAGTQKSAGLPSTSVEDALGDTTHHYLYSGDITAFRLDGDAAVSIDGQRVEPELLDVHSASQLPNLLVFDARNDETDYELRLDDADEA
jgi:hypothetical protein